MSCVADDSVPAFLNDVQGTDTQALARAVHVTYGGSLVTWAVDGRGTVRARLTHDIAAVLQPHRP